MKKFLIVVLLIIGMSSCGKTTQVTPPETPDSVTENLTIEPILEKEAQIEHLSYGDNYDGCMSEGGERHEEGCIDENGVVHRETAPHAETPENPGEQIEVSDYHSCAKSGGTLTSGFCRDKNKKIYKEVVPSGNQTLDNSHKKITDYSSCASYNESTIQGSRCTSASGATYKEEAPILE